MERELRYLKETYEISVDGCDDSTIFKMELTKEEFSLIDKVAKLCTKMSRTGCMPTMEIEKCKE